jgi:hypothetical protein
MQINVFDNGVNTDIDPARVPATQYTSGRNVRLVNDRSNGLVIKPLDGTSLQFVIGGNKVPIGTIDTPYGFSIIFSKAQSSTAFDEIGVYPAPNCIVNNNPNSLGFSNQYRPLKNILSTTGALIDCITTELNFSVGNTITGFVRLDDDNTFNIYFTDNRNPVRCINSGFKLDGTQADIKRISVKQLHIDKLTSIFLDTNIPGKIDLLSVSTTGKHLCGNYVYYMRYVTKSYDKTPFKCQSGPIQIAPTSNQTYDQILQAHGGEGGRQTDKSVLLRVSGGFNSDHNTDIPLDKAYDYVEFAYCYNYENGAKTFEIIDKLFPINGNDTIDVLITGDEPKIASSLSDILFRHPEDRIAETIKYHKRKLYIGNTSVEYPLYDTIPGSNGIEKEQYLIEFAKRIKISYLKNRTSTTVGSKLLSFDIISELGDINAGYGGNIYKDEKKTYYNVGYFRGETYQFGIQFTLNNGQETLYYPMKGDDEWSENSKGNFVNEDGIYRFPSVYDYPYYGEIEPNTNHLVPGSNVLQLLFVEFDMSDAIIYLNNNPFAADFFQKYISGYCFGRAERKPNLVYQGLMMHAFDGAPFGDWPDNVAYYSMIDKGPEYRNDKTSYGPGNDPDTLTNNNYPLRNSLPHSPDQLECINYAMYPNVTGGQNDIFFDSDNADSSMTLSKKRFPLFTRFNGYYKESLKIEDTGFLQNAEPVLVYQTVSGKSFIPSYPFAALPAIFIWKRRNDGNNFEDIPRVYYIEQFFGLHQNYLRGDYTATESNSGGFNSFLQTPSLNYKAIFSNDYFFEKNIPDGSYHMLMFSAVQYTTYCSKKLDVDDGYRRDYMDASLEDLAYDSRCRPYNFGAAPTRNHFVKYPSYGYSGNTNTLGNIAGWPIQAYQIYEWEQGAKEGFTSFFTQGGDFSKDCLFWFNSANTQSAERGVANRSFAIGRYIGIKFELPYKIDETEYPSAVSGRCGRENASLNAIYLGSNGYWGDHQAPHTRIPSTTTGSTTYSNRWSNDQFNRIVNVYRYIPWTIYDKMNNSEYSNASYNIKNDYDFAKQPLFKITPFIKYVNKNSISPKYVAANGDCFIGCMAQKILHNPETTGIPAEKKGWQFGLLKRQETKTEFSDTGSPIVNYDEIIAGFGNTIIILTENKYNTGMRVKRLSADSKFWNWEFINRGNISNSKEWDFYDYSVIWNKKEEDYFNTGYNVVLGDLFGLGYEKLDPYRIKKRANRIRYSKDNISGVYTDQNRIFLPVAFQDLDSKYGSISALSSVQNKAIAVQDHGIVVLEIDERSAVPDNSGRQLTLSEGKPLGSDYLVLSDTIGSQHLRSIVETENATYGVDVSKFKVWRITGKGFEIISDTKSIRSELNAYFKQTSPDGTNIEAHNINEFEVVGGHNKRHAEVVFTIKYEPNREIFNNISFIFSEFSDSFTSNKMDYNANFYLSINNDFIMCDTSRLPGFDEFWMEKDSATKCSFYGNINSSHLEIPVNGPEQINALVKTFDHWEGIMDDSVPDIVYYRTKNQTSLQNPFVPTAANELYVLPKWKEDRWFVPIKRATTSVSGGYIQGSILKGQYILIKLEYLSGQDFWIKSIFTEYKQAIR